MESLRRSKRREKTSRRQDLRPISLVFVITIVPALGTILVQTATMLPDFTEKVARPPLSPEALPILDWPTLL